MASRSPDLPYNEIASILMSRLISDGCATDIHMFSVPFDQLVYRAVQAASLDLVQRVTEVLELDLPHVLRLHVLDAVAVARKIANRSERSVLRQLRNVRRRVAVCQVRQSADQWSGICSPLSIRILSSWSSSQNSSFRR